MPHLPRYPRWNPPYKPPAAFAGAYLNRMAFVDPLVSRVQLKVRLDIGFGHFPGMPIDWEFILQTNTDNTHFYYPTFQSPITPIVNSTVELIWAVSDEGFEPLTYGLILFVRNFGILQFSGSVREWPQEGVENPVRTPWRQEWLMSIHRVALPDQLSFYDATPDPYDCSILE